MNQILFLLPGGEVLPRYTCPRAGGLRNSTGGEVWGSCVPSFEEWGRAGMIGGLPRGRRFLRQRRKMKRRQSDEELASLPRVI